MVGAQHPGLAALAGVYAWMEYAAASRQRWRALLRNASSEDARRRDVDLHPEPAEEVTQVCRHVCGECGATFGKAASLNAHFARSHLSNVARRYAEGDVCRACLKRFSSRDHLIYHLAFSKRGCLDLLMVRCEPLPVESALALDNEERLSAKRRDRKSVVSLIS